MAAYLGGLNAQARRSNRRDFDSYKLQSRVCFGCRADSSVMRGSMTITKIIGLPVLVGLGVFLLAVDTFDDGSTTALSLIVAIACFVGAVLCMPPKTA